MRAFKQEEFTEAPFTTHLGAAYANRWLQALRHSSGNLVDVLLHEDGTPVRELDDITDAIRMNYYLDGDHAKVIPVLIENQKFLLIKFTPIKN